MLQTRLASRALRTTRTARPQFNSAPTRCTRRFASDSPIVGTNATGGSSTSSSSSSSKTVLIASLAGASAGIVGSSIYGYYWYSSSGLKTLSNTASQTQAYVKQAQSKLAEKAPEPGQALSWLRETALGYAGMVPFAKPYVSSAFDDLDAVREKHGEKVDEIVSRAYAELKGLAKEGDASLATAQQAWQIIEKYTAEIASLAADAGQQILDKHPEVKEKVGGSFDQLKSMGDQYGPEAKKIADDTWKQVKDVLASGSGAEGIAKVKKLVEEKTQQLQKLGEQAWQKGLEQAQPYLEKNPKVKELIEENQDALKKGNVKELFNKVKDAVDSGNVDDLQKYVKDAAGKAKDSASSSFGGMGGGIEDMLKKVPGGDQIIPKLTQLSEVATKHGDDAQKILKDTINDIAQVLQKRGDEAKKIAEKASEDAKK